jgi:hypothetical protein
VKKSVLKAEGRGKEVMGYLTTVGLVGRDVYGVLVEYYREWKVP